MAGTTDDTTNLDLLESHVGPQREPAPDKPTRFGTICLNAVGTTASNKSTQLRVALKQATRFFCILVFMRIGWSALEERLQEQLFQLAALPNGTRLANTELQVTFCKVIAKSFESWSGLCDWMFLPPPTQNTFCKSLVCGA